VATICDFKFASIGFNVRIEGTNPIVCFFALRKVRNVRICSRKDTKFSKFSEFLCEFLHGDIDVFGESPTSPMHFFALAKVAKVAKLLPLLPFLPVHFFTC